MIRWTWTYEHIDDGISRVITAKHNESILSEVQYEFLCFLRGCGYMVDDPDEYEDDDHDEDAAAKDLRHRIESSLDYIDVMWNRQATDRSAYRADLANLTAILEGNQEAVE